MLCFSVGTATAQETNSTVTWKGEAELGLVNTTGNTETENLNARGSVVNERRRWRHSGTLDFARVTDQEETTARRFAMLAKTDYKFTERSYGFGVVTYEDDRFSGYEYQASVAVGYGRKLITHEDLILEGETGLGARRSEPDSADTRDEAIVRGALNLDWKISDAVAFVELFSVEAGEEITITKSVTALKSQIAGNLASKITYTVRHASEVPADTEETDTALAITLVYSFRGELRLSLLRSGCLMQSGPSDCVPPTA
ncbi:MAG: DUF481 domain-containing protein [Gammaproteobacteria bacterium]|nr:DUF481 domain-containing protein [Gammaproteobacteria bacterium]